MSLLITIFQISNACERVTKELIKSDGRFGQLLPFFPKWNYKVLVAFEF